MGQWFLFFDEKRSSETNTNVPKIFVWLLLTFFILDMANLSCAKRNFLKSIVSIVLVNYFYQEKIVKIGDFSFRILVILLQQHDLATKTTRSDVFPEKNPSKHLMYFSWTNLNLYYFLHDLIHERWLHI